MSIHPTMTLRCGDDWQFTGPINDNSGNPLPLGGATFVWKLDSLDETVNFLTITSVTVLNMTTSTVLYGPTKVQTAGLIPGTYYDTLRVTLSSGNGGGTFTVIEGVINASPNPT